MCVCVCVNTHNTHTHTSWMMPAKAIMETGSVRYKMQIKSKRARKKYQSATAWLI